MTIKFWCVCYAAQCSNTEARFTFWCLIPLMWAS